MQTKTDRNSGIELLRIISIIGVIVLHYNNAAIASGELTGSQSVITGLTESIFICSVDLFMMMSGYFLSVSFKRDPVKPIDLYLQLVFCSGISFIYNVIKSSSFTVRALLTCFIPNNYFATLYVCVYILSLYVNPVFDRLDEKKLRTFIMTDFAIFSIFAFCLDLYQDLSGNVLSGLNPLGMYGSGKGYTFVNFLLAYCIGGYIRKSGLTVKTPRLVMIAMSCVLVTFFGHMYVSEVFLEYLSPFIFIEAACLFMLFFRLDFHSGVINSVSRGCYMAFLFHFPFLGHIGIQGVLSAGSALLLFVHQLASASAIFLVCRIIYAVYAVISAPVTKWLSEHCKDITI